MRQQPEFEPPLNDAIGLVAHFRQSASENATKRNFGHKNNTEITFSSENTTARRPSTCVRPAPVMRFRYTICMQIPDARLLDLERILSSTRTLDSLHGHLGVQDIEVPVLFPGVDGEIRQLTGHEYLYGPEVAMEPMLSHLRVLALVGAFKDTDAAVLEKAWDDFGDPLVVDDDQAAPQPSIAKIVAACMAMLSRGHALDNPRGLAAAAQHALSKVLLDHPILMHPKLLVWLPYTGVGGALGLNLHAALHLVDGQLPRRQHFGSESSAGHDVQPRLQKFSTHPCVHECLNSNESVFLQVGILPPGASMDYASVAYVSPTMPMATVGGAMRVMITHRFFMRDSRPGVQPQRLAEMNAQINCHARTNTHTWLPAGRHSFLTSQMEMDEIADQAEGNGSAPPLPGRFTPDSRSTGDEQLIQGILTAITSLAFRQTAEGQESPDSTEIGASFERGIKARAAHILAAPSSLDRLDTAIRTHLFSGQHADPDEIERRTRSLACKLVSCGLMLDLPCAAHCIISAISDPTRPLPARATMAGAMRFLCVISDLSQSGAHELPSGTRLSDAAQLRSLLNEWRGRLTQPGAKSDHQGQGSADWLHAVTAAETALAMKIAIDAGTKSGVDHSPRRRLSL